MQFRPYQLEYINNTQINKSNLIISVMRSGKSIIMKGIIDKYHPTGKVLILVGIRHVILQLAEYYDESQYTFILAGKPFDHSKHIHLGSFQTLQRRTINLAEYDLICIDEIHMRFNTDIVKEIRKLSCTRVYFTGTPLDSRNKFISDEFDNVLEYTNIKQMIDDGYLAPTKFMSIGNMLADESQLSIQNGDYANADIDRIIDRSSLIEWLIVDDVKYGWSTQHKTIMYTNSIATTERIVTAFNSPNVRAIHSKLTKSELESVWGWFNTTTNGIIVNCRMLTIGVDIKNADTIVYLLPTMIHSLFLQSVFRASTKYGDKQAIVYDYSGMLSKVNPYSNEWKKPKLSCKDQCIQQYPNDLLAQYFCIESCKSNLILVPCIGKLSPNLATYPFISNYTIFEGTPCMESRPIWEYQYKQTTPSTGVIRKWAKCRCGCISYYDVQTITSRPELTEVYNQYRPTNSVIVIYNSDIHSAFVLFDKLSEPTYYSGHFTSSADIMTECYKYFGNNNFTIVANRKLSNLPNLTVLPTLSNAIQYINWHSTNPDFVKYLIRSKLTELCTTEGIAPGYVWYNLKLINYGNEKQTLNFLNANPDRSHIIKYFNKLKPKE